MELDDKKTSTLEKLIGEWIGEVGAMQTAMDKLNKSTAALPASHQQMVGLLQAQVAQSVEQLNAAIAGAQSVLKASQSTQADGMALLNKTVSNFNSDLGNSVAVFNQYQESVKKLVANTERANADSMTISARVNDALLAANRTEKVADNIEALARQIQVDASCIINAKNNQPEPDAAKIYALCAGCAIGGFVLGAWLF